MRINRDNYELFFIDYIEGNISPSDSQQLHLFLEANPDLKVELDSLSCTILVPSDTMPSIAKQQLKKTEQEAYGIANNNDFLCIAFLEGDLSASERAEFLESVSKSDELKARLHKHSTTKLIADTHTHFPNRQSLKRGALHSIAPSITRFGVTLAAASAIGAILWFGNSYFVSTTQTEIQANIPTLPVEKPATPSGNAQPAGTTKFNPDTNKNKGTTAAPIFKMGSKAESIATPQTEAVKALELEPTPSVMANINQVTLSNASNIKAEPLFKLNNVATEITTAAAAQEPELIAYSQEEPTSLIRRVKSKTKQIKGEISKVISIDVERDNEGIIEKVSIESKIFAFSTTRKKK